MLLHQIFEFIACLFLITAHPTCGYRILLAPFPYTSHTFMQAAIGEALLDKGHQVYMITSEKYPDVERLRKKFEVLTFKTKYPDIFSIDDGDYWMENLLDISVVDDMRYNSKGFIEFCYNALEDEDLLEELKTLRLDLIVVDATFISRCYLLIPFRLDVPFVSLTGFYETWLMRNPALPSFSPLMIAGAVTDDMTFLERASNLWTLLDYVVWPRLVYQDDRLISKYAPDADEGVTFNWLAGRSKLWLIDTDFLIDYARPVLSNEVLVGGLITKQAKPLPPSLSSFIHPRKNGNSSADIGESSDKVVIISFGTTDVQKAKPDSIPKFIEVFRLLPSYKFVWRFTGSIPERSLPDNVLVLDWLPQNDLLGDESVKLLIYHCGANSQFEALYHGVPQLCLPVFGDQPYNAARVQKKGLGLHMDLRDFQVERMVEAIVQLTTDAGIIARCKKASAIFRSRKETPAVRAAEAIEDVIRWDGMDHLHCRSADMPWYSYAMLDLILAFVVVPVVSLTVVCTCCFVRCCCNDARVKADRKFKKN